MRGVWRWGGLVELGKKLGAGMLVGEFFVESEEGFGVVLLGEEGEVAVVEGEGGVGDIEGEDLVENAAIVDDDGAIFCEEMVEKTCNFLPGMSIVFL